jgi:hypothetical protein
MVPEKRRVSGPGASYLMAPFTHASTDRPSRFSDGSFGVLYVASDFDTALSETMHHHAAFMAKTAETAGWTSQFREIVLDVDASLLDLRGQGDLAELAPDEYGAAQAMGFGLLRDGGEGICYPSVRAAGDCAALFYPDLANGPVQGRHLDYHWDTARVDLVRDRTNGVVYRVEDDT